MIMLAVAAVAASEDSVLLVAPGTFAVVVAGNSEYPAVRPSLVAEELGHTRVVVPAAVEYSAHPAAPYTLAAAAVVAKTVAVQVEHSLDRVPAAEPRPKAQ